MTDFTSEVGAANGGPGEPDPESWALHETKPLAPSPLHFVPYHRPWHSYVPWVSIISTSYVAFWILYQISPEFQAWVNYTVRYWSRYPTYYAKYVAWWLRQGGLDGGRSSS